MSLAETHSFEFAGIEAMPVRVSARASAGLPSFTVVGLPEAAARGTGTRMRAAFTGMGLSLPPRRVVVEVALTAASPVGDHHDLPVALCVLAAMGVLPREELSLYAAIGGLAQDGSLSPVRGVLSAAIGASAAELGLVCPASNGAEAAWGAGVEVLAAPDLLAVINHFRGTQVLSPRLPPGARGGVLGPDLADVLGMETVKRALEIAAAGRHGLLLVGPRTATSLLAAILPGLLPDLSPRDALEVSIIHSLAGPLDGGRLIRRPPYRVPSSDTSLPAMVGGGQHAGPGEVSLAHMGVLFLDHLPWFAGEVIDALRRSLEVGSATISCGGAQATYPARFQFVVAVDPSDGGEACFSGTGGLLVDCLDMVVHVRPDPLGELSPTPGGEGSAIVAGRVRLARARRLARRAAVVAADAAADAGATDLAPDARALAMQAMQRLGLSERSLARVLRVARTVADLSELRRVRRADVAEALAYRHRPA